jgi:hypothetical protein
MPDNPDPMIRLEPGGRAPILSYNVPEPTSYSGKHLIELDLSEDYFKVGVKKRPSEAVRAPIGSMDPSTIKSVVMSGMKSGFSDSKLFPNARTTASNVRFVEKPNPGLVAISSAPMSAKLAQLDPDEIAAKMQAGMRFNLFTSMFGTLTYNYVPEPKVVRPRLLLVETYRLSSYLGAYGAGRTIKTFSLLPGEKTKISVKTYTKRETDSKMASSILDSFTEESSNDFEQSLYAEQSNTEKYAENFEYHTEAEASCDWGFGSAKVSGGVKGGSNSAREEFAKNVSNATSKHTAKASAKRDVQIDTSYQVKEESGSETSIEREIQNINLSRTLNFVFRQMNQEFITLLHLVDIRVAYFNGFTESRREVPLPELDSLLDAVIVDGPSSDRDFHGKTRRQEIRAKIIEQLSSICDYQDHMHTFVTEVLFNDAGGNPIPHSGYLRTLKDKVHVYQDEATATEIKVPGIILSAKKYTMRTEGIIVDALLGAGEALDRYALRLQELEVAKRETQVAGEQAKGDRDRLLNQIVTDKDAERGTLLTKLLCPCGAAPASLRVDLHNEAKTTEGG